MLHELLRGPAKYQQKHGRMKISEQRQYWAFYWPLALTGIVIVLAGQFQNGALARYPDAVTELAIFALAMGTFGPFQASLNFVSQLSNVFARSDQGRRATLQFVLLVSIGLTVPFVLVTLTPAGEFLLGSLYPVETAILSRVLEYLLYLSPLIVINGLANFYLGLLVQSKLTGWVTGLNLVYLTTVVLALVTGFYAGWRPVETLVGAQLTGSLLHLGLLWAVGRRFYRPPREHMARRVTFPDLLAFFLPVTTTGVMFAISRPVLYALMGRTPDALLSIAAMRVGFDFSFIFQSAANQFRHFFVTFGDAELEEKQFFMTMVAGGLTVMMLLIAATPLSHLVLADLIGVKGEVLERSVEVILVMCFVPAIIILRNYFHGLLMHHRKTGGMAAGAILRVVVIYLIASLLLLLGLLNHVTAAFVLLAGFAAETLVVVIRWRQISQTG